MRVLAAAVLTFAACVPLSAPLSAQDAAAVATRERALVERTVPAMHTIADGLQAERQHLRALELRREIWLEYADDDATAREKSGFVRVGDQWRRDDARLVLDRDLKGDAKALKKLDQQWQKLVKDTVAEHRALALAWTAAAEPERAVRHWRRVLRFAPGDAQAATALALQPFEGFHGTPVEIARLQRARALRGACDWLVRTEFPAPAIDGERHPLLAAAKVDAGGVRSENFDVWGTLAPAELAAIAADCERALLLARTLFGTHGGATFVPAIRRHMVFLHDPGQYGAVLDACADQFDAQRLQFLKNEVDQAFVDSSTGPLRVHQAKLGLDAARDQAVRGVVQDASGILGEGLYEGIGHAACGLVFGRTLTFLLEQQRDLTAASWKQRLLAPDLAVWMQIAEESAWANSDTRTSELVLLSAARFTTEQRVKAWAICDYLLHWRPELLLELERCRSAEVRTPPEVEAEFLRRTQVDLQRIDHDFRQYWARGAALRRAMAADPVGDPKHAEHQAKVRARSLVDAVDAARAAAQRGPAGFFVATGPDVTAARAWDEQLVKVELQRRKKPKEPLPAPERPAVVGDTVLFARGDDAGAAVAGWLLEPARRDRLLHPGRDLFGASPYAGGWLLDVGTAALATRHGPPLPWPRHGQRAVPGDAPLAALHAHTAAALTAAGAAPDATVGMPLTLHFARAVAEPLLAQIGCRVRAGGHDVPGVLVRYGATTGADAAAGCVAFVPLAPLPAGSEVEATWALPADLLAKDETFAPVVFTVR